MLDHSKLEKRRQEAVYELLEAASNESDILEIKNRIGDLIMETLRVQRVNLSILTNYDDQTFGIIYSNLKNIYHDGQKISTTYLDKYSMFDVHISYYPQYVIDAMEAGEYTYIDFINPEMTNSNEVLAMENEGFVGRMIFPVISNDICVGLLSVFLTEDEHIDEDDIGFAKEIVKILALIIEINLKNKIIEKIRRKNAEFDEALAMQKILMGSSNQFFENGASISFNYHTWSELEEYGTLKSRLGGDYYEAIKINEHSALIIFADVMGHGVMANYFVPVVKGMFKMIAQSGHFSPAEIMTRMNRLIYDDLDKIGMFITCRIVYIDFSSNIIISANAGHTVPLLYNYTSGRKEYLNKDKGKPLGIDSSAFYSQETYHMDDEAILFMYTDGVYENVSEEDGGLKESFIIDTLSENKYESSEIICDTVFKNVKEFSSIQKKSELDDLMIVLVKNFG